MCMESWNRDIWESEKIVFILHRELDSTLEKWGATPQFRTRSESQSFAQRGFKKIEIKAVIGDGVQIH